MQFFLHLSTTGVAEIAESTHLKECPHTIAYIVYITIKLPLQPTTWPLLKQSDKAGTASLFTVKQSNKAGTASLFTVKQSNKAGTASGFTVKQSNKAGTASVFTVNAAVAVTVTHPGVCAVVLTLGAHYLTTAQTWPLSSRHDVPVGQSGYLALTVNFNVKKGRLAATRLIDVR